MKAIVWSVYRKLEVFRKSKVFLYVFRNSEVWKVFDCVSSNPHQISKTDPACFIGVDG
jgi:hypothetical protein